MRAGVVAADTVVPVPIHPLVVELDGVRLSGDELETLQQTRRESGCRRIAAHSTPSRRPRLRSSECVDRHFPEIVQASPPSASLSISENGSCNARASPST